MFNMFLVEHIYTLEICIQARTNVSGVKNVTENKIIFSFTKLMIMN